MSNSCITNVYKNKTGIYDSQVSPYATKDSVYDPICIPAVLMTEAGGALLQENGKYILL